MLSRLKTLFETPGTPGRDELQTAAAALLMEAARTDDHVSAEERTRIARLARERFGLSEADAAELLREAEAETAGTAHHFDYVRTIIDRCPPEERVWIVEMLWEVAYADGELHDLEASLPRRIGGMLGVDDRDIGAAKKRVMERLGLGA